MGKSEKRVPRRGRSLAEEGDRNSPDLELLRKIYKDLLNSGFSERHGIERNDMERFFVDLARRLAAPEGTTRLVVNTDGASRGNPGPAGLGFTIRDGQGRLLAEGSRYIGVATNNEAEYCALVEALREVRKLDFRPEHLIVRTDSELLVRQVRGDWRARHGPIRRMLLRIRKELESLPSWEIVHVSREKNRKADGLASEAVRKHVEGG